MGKKKRGYDHDKALRTMPAAGRMVLAAHRVPTCRHCGRTPGQTGRDGVCPCGKTQWVRRAK